MTRLGGRWSARGFRELPMADAPPADRRHLLDRFREEADTPRPFAGEVPERLKGLVSKTSVGLVLTVGSNPTLSASRASRDPDRGSRCFAERPLVVRQAKHLS